MQGNVAQGLDNDSKFIRVNYAIGGTTPGIVAGSFITKTSNNNGLAVDVGDIFTFI